MSKFSVRALFLISVCLLLVACSGLGPRLLPASRMDYNVSVDRSNNEEMLLNLVRLKYFETPVFLQVGSIASVYSLGFDASMGADIPDQRDFGLGVYTRFAPNISTSYSDNPTVTYTPYQGQNFAQQVLTELDFERLALLYRGGWEIEHLIPIFVYRIGGLTHDFDSRRGFNPERHKRFMEATEIIGKMDDDGNLDIVTTADPKAAEKDAGKAKDKDSSDGDVPKITIVQLRFNDKAEAAHLGALLGFDFKTHPGNGGKLIAKVRLVTATDFDQRPSDSDRYQEMPLRLRNLFRAMDLLALGVDVPEKDLAAKKTFSSLAQKMGLLDIRCASSRPSKAFVAVKHGDFWFYIADDDTDSKEIFQLLLAVFAIQASDLSKNAPILTLPVGGQ